MNVVHLNTLPLGENITCMTPYKTWLMVGTDKGNLYRVDAEDGSMRKIEIIPQDQVNW